LDVLRCSHCSEIGMLCLGIVGSCYLFFCKDVLASRSLTLVLAWSHWCTKTMSLNVFKRSVTDNWGCKCLCIAKLNALFKYFQNALRLNVLGGRCFINLRMLVLCIDMAWAAMYSVLVLLRHGILVLRCSRLNAII